MEYNKEYAKKVYAGLSKRGYTEGDLGSEDLFVARMGKENNRRLLYDMIARRGDANVGSWERFNERMSVPDIDKSQYTFTERELGLGGYQLGQPIPIIEKMRRKETEAGAGTHMGDDIYRTKEGQYTRTEVPFRTIEYPSLGMAQMAARRQQREDALAAYRSAYNRLEAPGEVDERTLIEWGNNMDNAPIEQKNLYARIMGKDAANRVDLDAVMRSYDETKKSLEGVEDPEGLAAYLIMPAEQRVKLPEAERNKYEAALEEVEKAELAGNVNELHNRLSSLMEQQRRSDIKMREEYEENRGVGGFLLDALLQLPVAENPRMQGTIPSSQLDISPEGVHSNEQNAALTAAGRKWNEMKHIIDAAANGDIFDGLDKALSSADTWSSDQMLRDGMAIQRVVDKFDKNGREALTENEKALLDAIALNVAVSEVYGDEISNWYKGGEMIGEMVPYVIEMLMNPLSGVGRKAAEKITRAALKKYGKELVKKKAGRFALKRGAAKLGASVAGATGMALTTGLPAVGADIQRRTLGDATYGYDNDGNIEYTGHVGGEDLGTSAYKAVTSRMLDNVSEMLGAGYAKIPFKWLQKVGKGTKVLGWMDNLANSKTVKKAVDFMEKTKWNGPIEEFLEEVHVGLINPVLVGDHSWEEFFTADNLATIAIGVAVPGAAISALNTIGGAADGAFKVGAQERWKMQTAAARGAQLWKDNPGEWRALEIELSHDSMEGIEKELKKVYNNPELTPEQKKVALEYAVYSLQWRTAQGVKEAFNEGKKFIDPMLRDIYGTAYEQRIAPMEANKAYRTMTEAEKNVQEILGIGEKSVDEWLNGRTAEEAARSSKEKLAAIKAYQAAKLDFEGRRDRFIAERDIAYMESDRSIQAHDNNGMVYATQYEGQPVYITGGDVVLLESGKIDFDRSSESLSVKFPDGHVEMIAPENFSEVFTEDRTEDLKAAKRAEIDERWKAEFDTAEVLARQQEVELEKRESGVVFDMTDPEGSHRVEILNEGNGMADILLDGKEEQIPTEELNRWKQEAGIQSAENGVQSADAVVDNATDNGTPTESEANVAPTGDNVTPVAPVENNEPAPVELPDVPDFFRLGGKNYSVASRNNDGSVDVMVDGKRETLPAGTDYSTHMPTDKKGEVQYEQMPVERTHEYFVQKVKDDEARAEMIEKRRKKAEAERKKFDKKPDPGIDPDAYEAKMTQWEADKKDAQAKVDYWKEVAKRDAEITRSETREAVNNIKPDVVEETADEFIANQLAGIKITPESFKRETGLSNAEQAQLVGVISNDGVSVERAAEIITENYDSELKALGFTGDVQDVRNAIISILSQGNPRGYAKRGYEARVQDDVDQQRADAEAWAKGAFDMKLEELYLYEETILPRIMRDYEGFDENEYYSNLAENNGYDTTRESESIGRGGELLQGEQPVPAGGTPVAGQRNEGGAVSDDVQGGGQNGVAQEEVPVNEPVGNSTLEQIKAELKDLRKKIAVNGNKLRRMLHMSKYEQLTADLRDMNSLLTTVTAEQAKEEYGIDINKWDEVKYDALWAERAQLKQQIKAAEERLKNAESAADDVQSGVNHSLSQEEAQVFITEMEANAEVAPEIELTIENWDSLFGEDGLVETPIGEVKMGENQFTKLMRQGRDGKLGMVKPTLENPDVIIEDESKAKNGETERPSSYVFVKSFKKADGSRYYYFTSVTVSKDGKEVIVSNQEKRRNAIANLLTNGKLVWKHADNVSNASDVANGLYSSQGNSSDLAAEGTDAPQTNVGVNEVYNRHTTAKQPTETVEASQDAEQSGTQATSSMNAPTTSSASEDRNSVSNSQENAQKSGEIAENGGERMYSQEELAEIKEQLGELNATSAPDFAVRLFSIRPWGALEEANAALKELLASYGETLNGQTAAVLPFLDEAQRLISENSKNQEPRSVEEDLDNGDKRITNYNSRGEVATVAIERDGKVVSVDSYDEGVLFEHTEYDGNGKATSVTRYDKQGNVVGTQVYEDGKAKTPMQRLADQVLARAEDKQKAKKGAEKKTADGQTVLYRTSEDAEDIPRLDKHRVGSGPLTDREVVMESDVYSKVLGKPRYYGQKQRNYVARQRAKMAQKATELAEKLNTPIEVRETAEGLTGKKAKAKGWYDVKSGNIVVVVSNHGSIEDIQATVLHEVVAHKGLRQMFGEHFDAFLDNVYNNVDAEIRAEIDALTEKYGNTREATEEYLASLAENTYFENVNPSLWSRIKQWFLNMLTEVGIKLDFELSDNELRYILWRSHQRLVNPGIYNPVTRITDVAVRARLGIGEYAPAVEEMSHVAEEDAAEYANKNQDIFVSNAQRAVEGIQQNNTMWSVDVTPEMQESVMQGQTMFRIADDVITTVDDFNSTHKGAAPTVIIDSADTLEEQLRAEGFSKEDIAESLKDYDSEFAYYHPTYDKVVINDHDVSKDELIGYLWHENAHRAVRKLYTREEMERLCDYIYKDDMPRVREVLSEMGYKPEELAEEAYVRGIEDVFSKKDSRRRLERGGLKPKEDATEEEKVIIDSVNRIVDFINNGREEERADGRRAGGGYAERSTQENRRGQDEEVRNSQETGENTQAGETRFRTVEETTDGSIDDVPAQPLTLMERIANSLLEVSAKNKENLELRASALRTFGRDINRVLSLMKAQREYDKSTVDTLVKLAKMYFKNAQLLGEVDTYTMGRVLSLINNVVGKRDVTASAAKLMDILLDAHTKALAGILDKAEKVKAKKVNAAGVEVMGRLDKYGQKRVEEYRAAKEMTPEKLEEAIYDSYNRLAELEQRVREELGLPEGDVDQAAREYIGDNDAVNVYMDERARFEGLTLAREYKESIQQVQEEIKDLKKGLKQAEEDYRLGNIDGKSLMEFRKSVAEAIMESKAGLIEGYHSLIYKFQENTKESSKRAKAFAQAQIDRAREIQHNANSDMQGIPADTQGKYPERFNSSVARALMAPMATFQGMMKKVGEKNVEGKGYLYERFVPQATMASDNEFRGKVAARVMIESRLKEIFGKKMTIAKFMKSLRKDGVTIEYREGNEMKAFALTRGQMLYIYMVNKMADGQMKLRRMGITDDVVAGLMTKLPEEAVQFADWAQDVLLKGLRGKYNAVHERVFGAPMAAIENYFPIKIRKEARGEKGDVSEVGQEGKPSTVTGSIIKRTKNATAIDLSADAMQVLMEHIDDMEHWAAFAEFNRDLNVLLNYKHFQNQVKNMTSVRYGSGTELWKNFKRTAQIVSGTYRPSDLSFDRFVQNITKGVTRAKINFRVFTAIKQLLSAPAFWTDAGVKELAYCYVNPKGSFKWAKENLPGFAERWQGRTMGNEKLLKSYSDWEIWRNETVEKATRWGMTPNAFIDALTVAQGARAVYMTKLEQFKKAGYTEQRANEKALQAAAEAYNESQQSSEGVYLSPLQVEGTAMAAMVSTFKNSNFGYTRKTAQAAANIKRKMRKGYKEETIAFMTKQMMRDGLSEENAKRFAEKVYYKSIYRDAANVAMFGFGLNLLWEAGGMAIYLFLGDDDEEKEKMKEEIAMRAALSVLQGIPFGDTMISAVTDVKEGDSKYLRLPELIAVTDIKNLAQVFDNDTVRAANDVLNILVSMGVGVTPQVFTDVLVAIADIEDFSVEELGMFVARLVNAPQSNLDRLMVDDAMENSAINADEIMRRYAEYKKSKNAPITQFFYPEEEEKKVIERYEKRFEKLLDERLENVVEDNDAYDLFYKGADARRKSELAKMRQKYLAEDKAKALEKLDSKELVDMVLNSTKEANKDINEEYFNLTNAEDEDTAFIIKSVKKALDDLKDGGKLSDKERGLLSRLNELNYAINKAKRLMERQPERAQEHMNNIREMRAKAMELINNYRKDE